MAFGEPGASPGLDPQASRPPGPMMAVAVIAVVVVALGLGWYWFIQRPDVAPEPSVAEAPAPPPAPEPPPAPTVAEPEPPMPLPELDASDAVVRDLVAALSSRPELAEWLVTDGLIRRFVAAVDNVAQGANPSPHVPFLSPSGAFGVSGDPSALHVDPRSYRRYDTLAAVIGSLDVAGTADLYRRLRPLMNDAYAELGYPDTPFDQALERAIVQILDTPTLETPPEVVDRLTFYRYADPELEALSPAQKQALGMGPDNLRIVKGTLRDLAVALGIPADRLP